MLTAVLSEEQKKNLENYGLKYLEWLKTESGLSNINDHREHEAYFKTKLSIDHIQKISDKEFYEIIKTLWASNFWGNKDWYIENKILLPNNGYQNVIEELKKLLYNSESIEIRYNEFRSNIKGLGPSYITEVLHFTNPKDYCLWNEKPKNVLPFLNLDNILPERIFKYSIRNGSDYRIIINALELIKSELKKFEIRDFIDLDMFFWFIYDEDFSKHKTQAVIEESIIQDDELIEKSIIESHEGAEYYLLQIGNMLGFNTYTPDKAKSYNDKLLSEVAILDQIPPFAPDRVLDTIKQIDIIWFDDEDNPTHCFEIEHTTDIVHGLDRLFQLKPYNADLFIVAPKDKHTKFEKLINSRIQYMKIKDRFRFISYEELYNFYETALPFYKVKKEVLGK